MIIVDTNVVSEAVRVGRNPVVVSWLDAQIAETLYFTATSLSEITLGIATLPQGKRRNVLDEDISALLNQLFGSRILPFDTEAAHAYGAVVAAARRTGYVVSMADGQIGAIAAVRRFAVATCDMAPFQAMGIQTINPWHASQHPQTPSH